MKFNIISEIISVWNSGKQGGFDYKGRDESEERCNIRGLSRSQTAFLSSAIDSEPASFEFSTDPHKLSERSVCLLCEDEYQEQLSNRNLWRPSGDGVCCRILQCIYDCSDVFREPAIIQLPECTHTNVNDKPAPDIISQPEFSTPAADQFSSNRHRISLLAGEDNELPETLEACTSNADGHDADSLELRFADIMVHREASGELSTTDSPESHYISALDIQELSSPSSRSMFISRFTSDTGETLELQGIVKSR